jgi:4-carboxymuconolactone decarboxylase
MTETVDETRYRRGLARLAELGGDAGEEIAPKGDLGRYIAEFGLGDIYSRAGLSLRDREFAAVAMLTAMGGRDPQVRYHLGAALNVGITAQELEELIIQKVPFAGFPTAINAFNLLRQVVAKTTSGA